LSRKKLLLIPQIIDSSDSNIDLIDWIPRGNFRENESRNLALRMMFCGTRWATTT
jgi:hypothetical protein